jgi:DNA-binding transcriptional MerR regulator
VASRRPEDLLEPVDMMRHLRKVELTLGQVCRVAGISRTQLDYWTTKARVSTKGKKQRLYDLDALEMVLLVKQGKDRGLSLQAAIEAAQRFRAAKAPRVPRRN